MFQSLPHFLTYFLCFYLWHADAHADTCTSSSHISIPLAFSRLSQLGEQMGTEKINGGEWDGCVGLWVGVGYPLWFNTFVIVSIWTVQCSCLGKPSQQCFWKSDMYMRESKRLDRNKGKDKSVREDKGSRHEWRIAKREPEKGRIDMGRQWSPLVLKKKEMKWWLEWDADKRLSRKSTVGWKREGMIMISKIFRDKDKFKNTGE